MITVFVKHYLNADGIKYFNTIWYPHVQMLIKQQPGFEFISAVECDGCLDILVKFRDAQTFDAWVANPEHRKVTSDLDSFRTRVWQWARTEGEIENMESLVWHMGHV